MEFISYIVVAVIGMWAGWHFRGIIFTAAISENPDKIIDMLNQIKKLNKEEANGKESTSQVEVQPECVNNYWYAYAKETGQFLGQGPSLEKALEMAADRFPSKSFRCIKPDNYSQTA